MPNRAEPEPTNEVRITQFIPGPLTCETMVRAPVTTACTAFTAVAAAVLSATNAEELYPTKSGIRPWVDPDTPPNRQSYTSSRGRRWDLVMSDEFNEPNRDFRPGKDHLWTSLEKPDGVNGAKELYSHNMTSTECDEDGNCYFYIKIIDDVQTIKVFNMYLNPPTYQEVGFQYRAAMVQSWNKFCFQGGMLEVRAQLPGAVGKNSGNSDLPNGPSGKVADKEFYPTWPGIWMMGNLGRAIFSGSTNRMWPFSYDKCEPDVFDPKNQRISACDDNPGYGMHPNRGRGAPEIDLLEGGGLAISSSLQVAPGMPADFRFFPVNESLGDNPYCMYGNDCKTPGANSPNVPTSLYAKRGYSSWYQGLRYAGNPFCKDPETKQDYQTIVASLKKGVEDNGCSIKTCPGSRDVRADLGLIDNVGPARWGINSNGTCFPVMNAYMGAFLCDPDNTNLKCEKPRNSSEPPTNIMKPFAYQMDAISSNWPVHLGAYTDFLTYQVEWVTGKRGWVRWMLDGYPIFEVTADAFTKVPQDAQRRNPEKVMIEEPMYVIFNVALSTSWGARPPNPGQPCRGDGKNPKTNAVCDSFPMYMKIDYIRLYQDLGEDLDADNYMQVGCDPKSHPTREWILGHLKDYEDPDNKLVEVAGQAYCRTDDDCTLSPTGNIKVARLVTGKCVKKRCQCSNSRAWGGPRCTFAMKGEGFSPPWGASFAVAAVAVVVCALALWRRSRMSKRQLTSRHLHAGAASSKGGAGGVLATPSHTTFNLV